MSHSTTNQEPIIVQTILKAPIDRIWRAITDGKEMPKWFFEGIKEFRPEVGFETEFDVHNESKVYTHHWKVTAVIPEKKIVYDWLYPGIVGSSFVTWELTKINEGVKLELTHTGGWTFPQDDPAFTRESCRGGWEYFFGRLRSFVES
jgi:uncharacterized protein YndB with AHSA1/START domain